MYMLFGLLTRQNSGFIVPHSVRLRAEVKPVRKGENHRWRGENRSDSTGNRPTQPINQPERHGGSAAEEIGGGGVKTGHIQSRIGR
jgi:hypothetical protein